MGELYSTKVGDTAPKLEGTLKNEDGTVQPLTGATVRLVVHGLADYPCTVVDVSGGKVETTLTGLTPGIYHMNYRVRFADGSSVSFPKGDYDVLEVLEAPAVTVILRDDFDTPQHASIDGRAVASGDAWQVHAGTATLSGGRLVSSGGTAFLASIDTRGTRRQGKVTLVSPTAAHHLVFRLTDALNYFISGSPQGTTIWSIWHVKDGVPIDLAHPGALPGLHAGVLTVDDRDAPTIRVYLNDALILTAIDTSLMSATRWGVFGIDASWDDLLITL